MSINRYDAKRDANEREIINALEAAGCTVLQESKIDLIVGRTMPDGMKRNFALEVKMPGKRDDLKPSQIKLKTTWKGHYAIVTSIDEALAACLL